jgi:hypothetical protein
LRLDRLDRGKVNEYWIRIDLAIRVEVKLKVIYRTVFAKQDTSPIIFNRFL